MPLYQRIINEIDPTANARGVEAVMRLQYGTLNHLPRETFASEIKLAKAMEAQEPGTLDRLADSYGL
jgi:hypothetical protein